MVGSEWAYSRQRLPWPTVVVASRDHVDGPFEAVSALASDWGAELFDAGLAGRLDAGSGYGPWPEGLMRLAGFLKRIGDRSN